jgi:SAM-dependent methyltransferase
MTDSTREEVIERERAFHDARFAEDVDPRLGLGRWYGAVLAGEREFEAGIRHLAQDASVLEYGCADGTWALDRLGVASLCRRFRGIDISPVAIASANRAAEGRGGDVAFLAMNAEALEFEDASFDLVYGNGVIHHLDLDRCFAEIRRVLKPGGTALFFEPLGQNPVINRFRGATPALRTADEHPLLCRDFVLARRHFARVGVRFYGLASLAGARLDPRWDGPLLRLSQKIDDVVLRFPGVGWLAWYALIRLGTGPA